MRKGFLATAVYRHWRAGGVICDRDQVLGKNNLEDNVSGADAYAGRREKHRWGKRMKTEKTEKNGVVCGRRTAADSGGQYG